MKGKISTKISLLAIFTVLLFLDNCTVLLTAIGTTEDRITPDIADTISVNELEKIRVGSQIIVNLKDGNYVCGKYAGIDTIPNEKYDEEYAELQKQMPEGSFLPSIGDTISFISKYGSQNDIKFLGFIENYIVLSLIQLYRPENLKLEYLIKIMDKHGKETDGEIIRKLISEGKIPISFLFRIGIEEYTGKENEWGEEIFRKKFIDKNDIDQIQIKAAKHATRNLLITGCLIDTAIIVGFYALLIYGLSQLP
jgi:hypothetical protein